MRLLYGRATNAMQYRDLLQLQQQRELAETNNNVYNIVKQAINVDEYFIADCDDSNCICCGHS